MNAHANKGFAARVGYALGSIVRFFLHDRRPVLRWVKRVSLFVALFIILVQNFTWLASAFMSLLCMGLVGWALVKGDFSIVAESAEESEAREAPYGRDVFGCPLDAWGNRVDGLDR
ncbi:hypothetical protein ACLHUA_33590 [Pseudomonas aeruginosa]|uniref:hypothetical protein n=1 Tax=Pseudomonas aeruginosa TaxID=287 RepID=UPI003983CA78